MLSAETNTAVRLWHKRTTVPVRQLPTMDRVPYPIVVCVATLNMTAALNPCSRSKPRRHPGSAREMPNQTPANARKEQDVDARDE